MRIIKNALLLLLAWFFIHCLWLVYDGMKAFTGKADVAVVLGNTAFADGSLSPWLQGRVDKALELYRNGQVKKIFVSGGTGTSLYPEGDAMRNYLVKNGVDTSVIIVDNKGNNTYLTAVHLAELSRHNEFPSVVAVTSFYHVTRTKWITNQLYKGKVSGACSSFSNWGDWYGITREFFACYKYFLKY